MATSLDIKHVTVCGGWVDGFKQHHTVVYRTVSGESDSVDSSTVELLRKGYLLKIMEGVEPQNT
jgi:hypothetical protein